MLEGASLLYLALPWVVFAAGWLRPGWAAGVVAMLVAAGAIEARRWSLLSIRSTDAPAGIRAVAPVILVAAVWTVLSGAGGFGFQNLDWHKHNLLLSDFSDQRWPSDYVVLQQGNSRAEPLTYYAAYYLPAAAVGKALGWVAANDALFAYTLAGAFLALLWFARLSGGRRLGSALLFIALSGLDVVGWALFARSPYTPTEHLEWWAGLGSFQYSSNTSLLFWVPQHALAGWIATGLVACGERGAPSPGRAFLVLALVLLWSPFDALGLAPFALLTVATAAPRNAPTFANLVAAPALGAIAVLFLASRGNPLVHGWLFSGEHAPFGWGTLGAFYVLEVGGFAALSFAGASGARRTWWWTSLALLLVLPLYRVGRFNDLTMRASIPALFVFWSFVARALRSPTTRWSMRRASLVALVCIGAVTPANEIARAVESYRWFIPDVDPRPLLVQDPAYRTYIGDGRSWFFRHLARPLRQVITIEAEHPRGNESAAETVAEESASDGRVLVLDGDAEIRLTYGFELERPIGAANLAIRYLSPRASTIGVALDGAPRGEASLTAGRGEWRFANMPLDAHLDAGWHELEVAARAPARIDAFVLIEAAR